MTLFDVKAQQNGTVVRIGGDRDTHRRLVDMGLTDSEFFVSAKRKNTSLVEFRREFSVVITSSIAEKIEVKTIENSVMRESKRR